MAKLKTITVNRGVSFQKGPNEPWYKFGCEVTLELEEGENSDEVKKKAWNTVDSEIEKQIKEILEVQ